MFPRSQCAFVCVVLVGWALVGCGNQNPSDVAQGDGDQGVKTLEELLQEEERKAQQESGVGDSIGAQQEDLPNLEGDVGNSEGISTKSAIVEEAENEDETQPQTAAEYAQQAAAQIRARNVSGAVDSLGKAVELDPKNRRYQFEFAQARNQLAFQTLNDGDREKAYQMFVDLGEYIQKYKKDHPENIYNNEDRMIAMFLYNQACGYSIQGEKDKALTALKESIVAGFTDLAHIKNDEDFASLRDSEEFKSLLKEQEAAIQEQKAAMVRRQLDENEPFPFQFKLPDLEGNPVSLAEFKGKVVIVDFWGTWCPPCRREVPHFVELKEKYAEKGLEIVGINYERGDPQEAVKKIKDFAVQTKINYPCVIGDPATQERVPELTGFPTTLFIDRAGVVRLKLVGYHPMEQLEQVVNLLLEESMPGAADPAKPAEEEEKTPE